MRISDWSSDVCSSDLFAVHRDPHVLRRPLDQRLGGQDVLDLGGADAEGERAERTVRRGVAVAADDRHAGLGQPLLRPDDVDDALTDVVYREVRDAELLHVLFERLDLNPRSEEHTSELQSLMRISYAVFCLKKT